MTPSSEEICVDPSRPRFPWRIETPWNRQIAGDGRYSPVEISIFAFDMLTRGRKGFLFCVLASIFLFAL